MGQWHRRTLKPIISIRLCGVTVVSVQPDWCYDSGSKRTYLKIPCVPGEGTRRQRQKSVGPRREVIQRQEMEIEISFNN